MEKKETPNCIEEQENTENHPLARPPDGGWGWAVVVGSFFCNVIVDGIIFSYGLLLPELSKDLEVSKGRLAWVGSLLAGFYLIAGPVVSGFANTYGCRPVTIVGTVIAAASFALASITHSVELLCLTFGVFGGIGFGFIYLPAVVTVGYYFEKKRAFATGLAVCGSGVGTFLMAPFVQYLLSRYDWRGTMLVLSGVVLNCICFGALFRPLPVASPKQPDDEVAIEQKPPLLQRIKMYRDERRGSLDIVGNGKTHFTLSLPEICSTRIEGLNDIMMSPDKNSPPPSYSEVVGADEEEMFSFLRPPSADKCLKYYPLPSIVPLKAKKSRYADRPDFSRPFYRQDILYSASVLNLPEFKKSHNNLRDYAASVTKIPKPEPEKANACISPAMRDTFRQMLDVSLLRSPTFLLLGVGGFLTLAGFFVPFMFVVDRAVQQGIALETATYILPAIGLTNTVGRIFCGWISDRPSLNALSINNVALIIGGFVTILSSCFTTLELLLVYAGIFGFSIGCFATLRSIVIVELLGLDRLTNAFGLLLLFQGLASIIGSPVAGMFYDATGSYDASFYISGSLILLSGLLGIPLRRLSEWEKRKKFQECTNNIVISVTGPEEAYNIEPVMV